MAEFHTIKAQLYDNLLTENPDDFTARVVSEKSLGIADVCKTAVSRGGADITAKAMEHAVSLFLAEMAYRLQDGFSVNTGYFNVATRIMGVFRPNFEVSDGEEWKVLVKTQFGNSAAKLLKEPRTVEFSKILVSP